LDGRELIGKREPNGCTAGWHRGGQREATPACIEGGISAPLERDDISLEVAREDNGRKSRNEDALPTEVSIRKEGFTKVGEDLNISVI